VGIFDFFRRRSERESVLSSSGASDAASFSVTAAPETAVTQSSTTLDATGAMGLRDDMFEILRRHGIDPESGQAVSIDASSMPGLAAEIQQALSTHGIQIPEANWAPQGTEGIMQMGVPPAGPDTDDRLRQLTELLQSGLITQAEFEQQRSRIIGDV
jgi:Short C-terminal domain